MSRPLIAICAMLMLSGLAFADILEYGDEGEAFALEMSASACEDPGVSLVFICSGDVVKAVLSAPGDGSVFYKPDGRIILCPDVPPSEAGAECMQMMIPNFCPDEPACVHTAPDGDGETGEELQDPSEAVEDGLTDGGVGDGGPSDPADAPDVVVTPDAEPASEEVTDERPDNVVIVAPPESDLPRHQSPAFDASMDNLAILIALLGVVALILLFTIFRKSIEE